MMEIWFQVLETHWSTCVWPLLVSPLCALLTPFSEGVPWTLCRCALAVHITAPGCRPEMHCVCVGFLRCIGMFPRPLPLLDVVWVCVLWLQSQEEQWGLLGFFCQVTVSQVPITTSLMACMGFRIVGNKVRFTSCVLGNEKFTTSYHGCAPWRRLICVV